jgi:hypothetical protein
MALTGEELRPPMSADDRLLGSRVLASTRLNTRLCGEGRSKGPGTIGKWDAGSSIRVRRRVDLVAPAASVSGLGRLTLELLEHVIHRRVVADRVHNSALVVVAYDDDGAVAEPSSLPQTPRPLSAFVHWVATIDRVRVGLNHPLG